MARRFLNASSQRTTLGSAVVTGPPLTIACWARAPDITGEHVIGGVFKGSGGGTANSYYLDLRGNVAGDPLTAVQAAAGSFPLANTTTSYLANTWHHCAGVFASDTSRTAYLDGGGQSTDTTAGTSTGINNTTLGAYQSEDGTSFFYFDSDVAEFAIWKVALTHRQIQHLARGNSPLSVERNSLVLYLPLVGGSSSQDVAWTGQAFTTNGSPGITDHPVIIPAANRSRIARIAYSVAGASTFQNIVGRPFSLAGVHGLAGD